MACCLTNASHQGPFRYRKNKRNDAHPTSLPLERQSSSRCIKGGGKEKGGRGCERRCLPYAEGKPKWFLVRWRRRGWQGHREWGGGRLGGGRKDRRLDACSALYGGDLRGLGPFSVWGSRKKRFSFSFYSLRRFYFSCGRSEQNREGGKRDLSAYLAGRAAGHQLAGVQSFRRRRAGLGEEEVERPVLLFSHAFHRRFLEGEERKKKRGQVGSGPSRVPLLMRRYRMDEGAKKKGRGEKE